VLNYFLNGSIAGNDPVCVPLSTDCPCGANTLKCPDPNDKHNFFCAPKTIANGKASCPQPCSSAQEAAGNATCSVDNLDSKGAVVSTTVTCVAPKACKAGSNSKKCPSGSVVDGGTMCTDPYQVLTKARRLDSIQKGITQTSMVVFVLTSSKSSADLTKNYNTVKGLLKTALNLPATISLEVAMNLQGTPTQGKKPKRRATASSSSPVALVTLTLSNNGASQVTPKEVAAQANAKISQKDPSMVSAFASVGSIDTAKGVSMSTSTAGSSSSSSSATTGTTTTPSKELTTTAAAAAGSTVIKGDITIHVSDADAFVKDVNTSKAVASGLATTLGSGVKPDWVAVTLTVQARRLQGRQLVAGSVNAAYTITIPANSGVDVSAIKSSASTVDTSALGAAITSALHTMNPSSSYSLTVTGASAPVVSGGSATTTSTTQASTKVSGAVTKGCKFVSLLMLLAMWF